MCCERCVVCELTSCALGDLMYVSSVVQNVCCERYVVFELSGCALGNLMYVSSVVQSVCCERCVVCELTSCALGDLLCVSCPAWYIWGFVVHELSSIFTAGDVLDGICTDFCLSRDLLHETCPTSVS